VRLAKLSEWAPAPGRIVVWRPTAAAQAAADAAPVHPGAPSFLQGDHLGAYARTVMSGGTHRAWTGVLTELPGAADLGAIGRALRDFVMRHEGMRTWFGLGETGVERHLVPADAVAFEAEEVPSPADWDAQWEETLVGLVDGTCTPDSWAPFLLAAVVREDDVALVWACDHAFTDGASQLMVLTEIAELYQAEQAATAEAPVDPAPAPDQTSFLSYVEEEQAAAAAYGPDSPELAAWIDIVQRYDGRLPRFPLDLGLEPGETAPVLIRDRDALTGDEVNAFEARCKDAGAGFTSGVFAALALTDTSFSGEDRWWGVTVVGTRGPAYLRTQGWLCNFVPVEFALPEERTFEATAAVAHQAFKKAMAMATMPVHVALGALLASGFTTPDELGSPQLISYLDLRRFPGIGTPAYDNGIHFTGEGRTGNASMWIQRDVDRLQLGAQIPDTEQAQRAVAEHHDRAIDLLRRAARGSGA